MKLNDYAAVLRELETSGELTPEGVVEHARSEDSPIHHLFEWDDDRAAHQYRIEQARELIRSVRVTVTVNERPITVPNYVRDPSKAGGEQGYKAVSTISDDDQKRDTLMAEFRRAASALDRARNLATYFDLTAELDDAQRSIALIMETHDDRRTQ